MGDHVAAKNYRAPTAIGRFAAAVLAFVSTSALAQNQTTIEGGATTGTATVNAASGNYNEQANVGLISSGNGALSVGTIVQHNANPATDSGPDSSSIAPNAFAGSSGWLAVNGASGNDNQQANVATFAFGAAAGALADAALNQSRASTQTTGGPAAPAPATNRSVAIGDGAFGSSQGLIQLSLVGGDRNSSANTFALSVGGPGNP